MSFLGHKHTFLYKTHVPSYLWLAIALENFYKLIRTRRMLQIDQSMNKCSSSFPQKFTSMVNCNLQINRKSTFDRKQLNNLPPQQISFRL